MAKNDHKRMQNEVDRSYNDTVYGYGGSAGTPSSTINTRGRNGASNGINIPGTPATPGVGGMNNLYSFLPMGSQGMKTYDDIMGNYQKMFSGDFNGAGDFGAARAGFSDLMAGGGVNQDAMRNRAMAETRATYANATRNLNRQKSIQGGYSPGYTTALTRMARNQGQDAADASTNAEAAIQELISRNKATGASGLAGIGGALGNIDLNALQGMGNTYFNAGDQLMKYQGLQQAIAQMMMQGRSNTAQIPGNFSNAMGNIGDVLGLGSKIIGGMVGLGGIPQIPPNIIPSTIPGGLPPGGSTPGFRI